MPDAVVSRKRQVSRLRDCGFKRGFGKSLYKAPAVSSESGSLERNFRINPVEGSLAGNSRGCVFCDDAFFDRQRVCLVELGEFISSLENKGF